MTGDVGAVDPTLLGTGTLQEQQCTTDYVIIPNPSQGGTLLTSGSDRFCGLGLTATTSKSSKIFKRTAPLRLLQSIHWWMLTAMHMKYLFHHQ